MTLQENIRNHLNKTRLFKACLIVLFIATGISSTYFLTNQENDSYNYESAEPEEVIAIEDTSTKIEDPKFYGFDIKKNPFTIIAKDGTQLSNNLVELTDIFSEIKSDNKLISISADTANMLIDSKNLTLDKNVFITVDNEYFISTTKASIDMKNGYAHGDNQMIMQSESSLIEGNAFEITDNFNTIIIKNGVHTNLIP